MAKPALHDTDFGDGVDALFSNIEQETPIAQMVELSNIKLPTLQPRRYFDLAALDTLAKSIKKNGILQPLVVRPLDDGNYELVAGERRYRASKIADLTEVPCVSRNLSSDEAYEIALVENLQREDLNPVDETEGILELLERLLDKNKEEIITLFHKAKHKERASGNNVISTDEWQKIEQVFERVSKITPDSFANNRLPLLNMPGEVLNAVREGQLEYTKAKVIGRLTDIKIRKDILKEAINDQLSLTVIKLRIKSLISRDKKTPKASVAKVLSKMDSLYRKAKKPDLWDNAEKREKLETLLSELELLLNP
ncbi:MAG: ParB/RepB/Spo0J family partition protein [Cyanobacteria bacterium J06629_9]